jgi:nucleoside-diphosphate-sugar epimerase
VLKQLFQKRDLFEITVFDVLNKKSKTRFAPFKKEVDIVYGDLANHKTVRSVCSNKDVVIHLAAIIPPLADDQPELATVVNTQGTENLIRNLEELSPKTFFLYSSSISVYGDRISNPWIKVGDPVIPSPGDQYAKTKIMAEEIVQNCKLDWSIFRLCAIMGGHKISKLMFHQPLDTSLEIATPEDTGRAFVAAIDHVDLLLKNIYNLGGGETCRSTYEEFLVRSFKLAGLGKLNFPPRSFAEKNFHCGYYEDGDLLDHILHFRKDSLEEHFLKEKLKTGFIKRLLTELFKKSIKKYLLKQSEPFHAYANNDENLINHFFNPTK